MSLRYFVALCLAQVCIAQTITQTTENKTNLRNTKGNKSYNQGIWDVEKTLLGTDKEHFLRANENNLIESDSDGHKINKEPMTVAGLTPEPILNAAAKVRSMIQEKLFDVFEDALKDVGAKELVDGTLGSVKEIADTMIHSVKALYDLTHGETTNLGNNIDKMFEKRLPALYEHLDGKCFQESEYEDSGRMRHLLLDDYTAPEAEEIKEIGSILSSLSTNMDNSSVIDTEDLGAICVNVKGLIGSKYQTKSGGFIESQAEIGLDAGVTIPNGDLRVTGNVGFQIGLGKEDIGNSTDERMIKSGTTTNSNTLGKLKNNTSLSYRGEAGVKIYLPGATSAMDGWGGLDIGFTLKALPNFDGLIFHLRHPWYSCSNILDHRQWSVTGFTINYFSFTNFEELKNGTSSFPGFADVVSNLKEAFDFNHITSWEDEEGFSLTVGAHLSIGISNTNKEWDLGQNFLQQPYSGGPANCHNRRASEISNTEVKQVGGNSDHYPESVHLEALVGSIHQSTQGRILGISANNVIKDIMSVLIEFLGDGGIVIPYCFGKCNGSDSRKYIKGNVTIEPPDSCDGVVLKANAEELTLANAGYLILSQVDEGLANLVSGNLGGLGELGISKPSIALEVTIYPKLSITVTGSPQLPSLPSDAGFEKVIFDELEKIIEGLTLEVSATIQSLEYLELGFRIASQPLSINKNLRFEDTTGLGFSVYATYQIIKLPVPTSQILTLGLKIPMCICTSNCTKAPHEQEKIYLIGDVSTELTFSTAPPAVTIGGTFSMIGTWNNAFGLPILHISNVIAGAWFDISKVFPPPPSKLILGGAICLGSENACRNQIPKEFVKAKLYLQVNTNVPEENGVIAMITTATIEHLLNIAGALDSSIKKITNQILGELPTSLTTSGIYPFSSDMAGCDAMKNDTALAVGDVQLNLDCFAYYAVAPMMDVEIKEVGVTIPRGISFGGQLKFMDKFDLKAKGIIDVLQPPLVKFNIDATMVNLKLGNFLQLGAEYSDGAVTGDARFYVDFQNIPPSLNVYIRCALYIPIIKTYGLVHITVNNEIAEFRGILSFFGGIYEPNAYLYWTWDMAHFKAEIGDILFANGILKVDHLKMEIDAREGLSNNKASFSAQISVLCFVSVGGSFGVKQSGGRFEMDFSVYANLGVATGKAWGSALLDVTDITETSITDIDFKLSAPQWVKDVAKAIANAVNVVGEALSEAFDFAADVVQAIGKEIAKVGKAAIDTFENIAQGLGNALEAIFDGDIGASMKALGETAKKVLGDAKKVVKDVANEVHSTVEDVAKEIDNLFKDLLDPFKRQKDVITQECCHGYDYMYDSVNCRYKKIYYKARKRFKECWGVCVWGGCIEKCNTKYTSYKRAEYDEKDSDYHDCVKDNEEKMEIIERYIQQSEDISDAAEATKSGNKALLNADINNLPARTISNSNGNFEDKIPIGDTSMRTTITGSANRLENEGSNTFSVVKDFILSTNDTILNSLNSLQNSVSKKVSDIYLTNLGTIDDLIKVVKKGEWTNWMNSYGNKLGKWTNWMGNLGNWMNSQFSKLDTTSSLDEQQGGYCGFASQFHDGDRQFKFKFCTPNMQTHHKGGTSLHKTPLREEWDRECPDNEFISKIKSWYNNDYQDRDFDFYCNEFEGFDKGNLCKWSNDGNWVNTWKNPYEFECDDNMMLTAVKSTHSNDYLDRLYSFKCCHVERHGPIRSSEWTNYLNEYDGDLEVVPEIDGQRASICGIGSHHNNHYQDRRFKFLYCRPRSSEATYQEEQHLSVTTYEGTFTKECPGNRFITHIKSTHSNDYEDRQFEIRCGEFNGYTRNEHVCEWSNGNHYVNVWDGEFTFACSRNMAMVAISSDHSNEHEDRRFKFKCCRMQEKIEVIE